jgi:hypothetical protein
VKRIGKTSIANCRAKLHFKILENNDQQYFIKQDYTCGGDFIRVDGMNDVRSEMMDMAKDIATSDNSFKGRKITKQVNENIRDLYAGKPIITASTNSILNSVKRARREENEDWNSAILSFPLNRCGTPKESMFLQFSLHVNIDNELQRIIGWAHPILIHSVKHGPVHVFIDCTFHSCPKGFSQLLVLMIYSNAEDLYIPIFYVLLQSKKELVYFIALQNIMNACDWQLKPKSITCDFERGLINACEEAFKNPTMVLCFFHWKKALKEKLVSLAINTDLRSFLIGTNGVMNMLTIIPIEDIVNKGKNCHYTYLYSYLIYVLTYL